MQRNTLRLSLLAVPALLAACASTPDTAQTRAEPAAPPTMPLHEPAPPKAAQAIAQPFREDAPRAYTVKAGDTLWGLAQRFLKNPWAWPEIWYDNPRVRNPHLIFPGDELLITQVDGQTRLTKKLTPHMRILPTEKALPTLPLEAIAPFLSYPQLIEPSALSQAPQVIGSPDGRLVLGRDDLFYAHGGALIDQPLMAVVRPHRPLIDPATQEVLGFEADAIGKAVMHKSGDPATLRLTESPRETRKGDRLVSLPPRLAQDLALKAPPANLQGRIISLPDTTTRSAQWQIIALNKGRADGMEPGHVIRLRTAGGSAKVDTSPLEDPAGASAEKRASLDNPVIDVRLPDVVLGDAVVFLAYDRVSYALITEVTRPVRVGDCFGAPSPACH